MKDSKTERLETGIAIFDSGYNCAQAVLKALCDLIDMDPDMAVRISTGFGSGLARTQILCGAVSGGILALNQIYGRKASEGKEAQEAAYKQIRRFMAEFEDCCGSVVCREILDGCDLNTDEGQARYLAENMRENCENCVRTAIGSAEKIIQEL